VVNTQTSSLGNLNEGLTDVEPAITPITQQNLNQTGEEAVVNPSTDLDLNN